MSIVHPYKAALIVALMFMSPQAAEAARVSYFVNHEVQSDNLSPFPKWTGVLSRYFNSNELQKVSCASAKFNNCQLKEWEQFLETQKGKPLMTQVTEVNRYLNQKKYIIDPINWGMNDYWETPLEFKSKNGDCEDYAISKFISLRALGVPNDQMRIIILNDLNLNLLHAVLIVFVGKDVYVLDNQTPQVKNALEIYHYKPIYSINERHWWKHVAIQR